jgi:hypothetical protein
MKWTALLGGILAVMALTMLAAPPGFAQPKPEFCWKDSYGRGVGTVPTSCAPGQEMRGLLCYKTCPQNMQWSGVGDCSSICPAGFRDDGLFCRRAEYGRGAGYGWEFRDGFSSAGMISRCESDNGTGKCEMWGAIAYPKCRPGYSAFGCCICRPDAPNCAQLGLGGQLDLSCAKIINVGQPELGVCPGGSSNVPGSAQERDAGLCYRGCDAGYTGVGPVCWKKPPQGWVDCGMGAAVDATTCAKITFGQLAAVGNLGLTAASLGSSLVGTAGAGVAANAGKLAALMQKYNDLVAAYNAAKNTYPALQAAEKAYELGKTVKTAYTQINTIKKAAEVVTTQDLVFTAEDLARLSAEISAIVDTSGVSATIAAFTYPKCSKYEELLPH